jgi:NAD(P)-dependent dehydrogenase (short-subunit alcohol dehydrogenase family)
LTAGTSDRPTPTHRAVMLPWQLSAAVAAPRISCPICVLPSRLERWPARQSRSAGDVDILVNNAGIAPAGSTPSMTEAQIDTALAANVKVPFVLVAELAPGMAERGEARPSRSEAWLPSSGSPEWRYTGRARLP